MLVHLAHGKKMPMIILLGWGKLLWMGSAGREVNERVELQVKEFDQTI